MTESSPFPPLAPDSLLVFLARERCLRGAWLAGWEAWLSPDEWERAGRFRCQTARRDYLLGRAMTRRALTHYVGLAPPDLRFAVNAYGKPAAMGAAAGLAFSLSHSAGRAALAIARGPVQVGVDIEAPHEPAADWRLGRRFFDPREAAELEALPESERAAEFLRLWVLKEAFVKAIGLGLSQPLDSFAFLRGRGVALVLHPPTADGEFRQHWHYGSFQYAGCCGGWVVGGGQAQLRVELIEPAAG